jgi:hypothetical protein
LVCLALLTGFWVYNTFDHRWGGLVLQAPGNLDIQGIHGTIALTFLLVLPLFAVYSFRLGAHLFSAGTKERAIASTVDGLDSAIAKIQGLLRMNR